MATKRRYMISFETSGKGSAGGDPAISFTLSFTDSKGKLQETKPIKVFDRKGDDHQKGDIYSFSNDFGASYPDLNAKSIQGITVMATSSGTKKSKLGLLKGKNKPNWLLHRVVLVFFGDLDKKHYKKGYSTSSGAGAEIGYCEAISDQWFIFDKYFGVDAHYFPFRKTGIKK